MSGRRNTHRDERPSPRQYRNPYTESVRCPRELGVRVRTFIPLTFSPAL